MLAMGKSFVFFVIHCLPFISCNEIRYNYLVMKAGDGSIFTHLWNESVGGLNVGDGTKHHWFVPRVAAVGNFRSPLVDSWDSNVPDKIYFSFFNHYGDELFWISFNGSGSNSNISSWMKPSRVLGSSHDIMDSNLGILYPISYPVYGADLTASGGYAWFAVWGGSVYPLLSYYPVFLFSNRKDSSFPLSPEPRLTEYVNCYDSSIEPFINLEDVTGPLTIEQCVSGCDLLNFSNQTFLEKGSNCHCGKIYGSHTPVDISYCTGQCDGNPEQKLCGLVDNYYALYISGAFSTDILPTVPGESVEILSSTVYSMTGMETIEFNLTQHLQGKTHAYITGITAISTDVVGISILYNFSPNCNISTAKRLENVETETVFFTNGTYIDIGLIKTSCLYITSKSFINMYQVSINISLYGPTSNFIQAPILAIRGAWTQQESTTIADHTTTDPLTTTSITDTTTTEKATDSTTSESTTDSTTLESTTESTTSESTTESITSESTTESTTSESTTESTTSESTTDSTPFTTGNTEEITTDMSSSVMSTQSTSFTSQDTATTTSEYTEVSTQSTTLPSQYTPTTASYTSVLSSAAQSDNNNECPLCNCNYIIDLSINMTTELVMKLEQIRKNLTVNKKLLSSYIRSKTSAKDERPSSAGIGYVGVIVLCVVGTCILLNDMTSFYSIFKLKIDKIRQWHNGLV